ncbi:MAG: RDD family protein [Clostridia bacterium]|nr:RDD family protein [Clostridia bacterium]
MLHELQKASMWKRISAFIFDFIMLAIIAVGIALLCSALFGYDTYTAKMDKIYAQYEEKYGISFDITEDEYNKLTDTEKDKYKEAEEAFNEDKDLAYTYTMVINLTLTIMSISVFTAYIICDFVVPLIFKNGQTLGKKIFGLGVMRTNHTRINSISLFIRTILGKCTIETMVPALIVIMIFFSQIGIVGIVILGLLLILELAVICSTSTRSTVHDLLAMTVVVDMQSQMIFETEDELLEYKKKLHAENAAKADY